MTDNGHKSVKSPKVATSFCPRWRDKVGGSNRNVRVMDMVRQVIVFDAADLQAESAFWAGILDGFVVKDDDWHSVIDAAGQWRIGVQLAPDHVPPDWPDWAPQQVHLDLHVHDPRAAREEAARPVPGGEPLRLARERAASYAFRTCVRQGRSGQWPMRQTRCQRAGATFGRPTPTGSR
jgi:hypothetical protein